MRACVRDRHTDRVFCKLTPGILLSSDYSDVCVDTLTADSQASDSRKIFSKTDKASFCTAGRQVVIIIHNSPIAQCL